jgi:hypothetical protein
LRTASTAVDVAATAAVILPYFTNVHLYILKLTYIIEITRNGKLVSRDLLHPQCLPRVPRDERFRHLVTAFQLQRSS